MTSSLLWFLMGTVFVALMDLMGVSAERQLCCAILCAGWSISHQIARRVR